MAILPTGIGPVTGYNIERSLRFNSADSAYLNRTFASAGNRKTWTWSGWVKRGKPTGGLSFFGQYTDGNNQSQAKIRDSGASNPDTVRFYDLAGGSFTTDIYWTPVYRDYSGWYHVMLVADTTQATNTNRIKLYINGVQVTSTISATWPAQNTDLRVNINSEHLIGQNGASGEYADGYMTEINFIDGQALTPSSFGETDAQTGVWKPKAYTGTYGTNGFFLKFADNSNTTAATLGKDSSSNGNNWTPNNFSVTAGIGNDSLVDSPTNYGTDTGVGGTVRGNYCTLNPLNTITANVTLVNGNLDYTQSTLAGLSIATFGMTTGKWYWEHQIGATNYCVIGMYQSGSMTMAYLGESGVTLAFTNGGSVVQSGVSAPTGSISSFTSSDIIGFAYDADAGTLTVYRNNTSALVYTGLTGTWFPAQGANNSASGTFNFGQRAFAYTAPSGFKALCTTNLPTPTIGATSTTQAGKYFNPVLYTGNGSTQSITGVGFQPDLVWCKSRSNAYSHTLIDAVRGRAYILSSNTTSADAGPEPSDKELTAFTSDGFNLGQDFNFSINSSGATFVAWNWKANGAGSSNTAGSISSTVSANTTAGFSIVTYTGNGSAGATVGHGLGAVPQMIIAKSRSNTGDWPVYHVSLGNTKNLILNTTAAETTSSSWWNNTTPTSTLVTLGNNSDINGSTRTYVMYCFAPVAGYSAFGSYTGNGSADGPFVYTGFKPAFVLVKGTSSGYIWTIEDNKRDTFNPETKYLQPQAADAEGTFTTQDFTSNGFKIRTTDSAWNGSGITYIYAAFAENPFKFSLAR